MDTRGGPYNCRITAGFPSLQGYGVLKLLRWVKLTGLDKEKFPTLIPNDGIVGPIQPAVAEDFGLHPATPVVAGISDSNASVIGSGAVQDYEAIIYIGTSLYMTCHVPSVLEHHPQSYEPGRHGRSGL